MIWFKIAIIKKTIFILMMAYFEYKISQIVPRRFDTVIKEVVKIKNDSISQTLLSQKDQESKPTKSN